MNNKVETDDWKLGCYLEWRPKYKTVACPYCAGLGEIGGGFGDLDGPRTCNSCFGSGMDTEAPKSPKPEIPADLREHMAKAWADFIILSKCVNNGN